MLNPSCSYLYILHPTYIGVLAKYIGGVYWIKKLKKGGTGVGGCYLHTENQNAFCRQNRTRRRAGPHTFFDYDCSPPTLVIPRGAARVAALPSTREVEKSDF